MLQCHFCGAPVGVSEPIPREAECGTCGRDLHSCRNCRYFDPRYARSCREPMADPVDDLDRRNFREYFSFSPVPIAAGAAEQARRVDARSKLEALFKKKPADSE